MEIIKSFSNLIKDEMIGYADAFLKGVRGAAETDEERYFCGKILQTVFIGFFLLICLLLTFLIYIPSVAKVLALAIAFVLWLCFSYVDIYKNHKWTKFENVKVVYVGYGRRGGLFGNITSTSNKFYKSCELEFYDESTDMLYNVPVSLRLGEQLSNRNIDILVPDRSFAMDNGVRMFQRYYKLSIAKPSFSGKD